MVYMPGNSSMNQGRGASLYSAPNQTGYRPPAPPKKVAGNGPNKSSLYGGGMTRGPSVQTTPGSSMYGNSGTSSMSSGYNPLYQARPSVPTGPDYGMTRTGPGYLPTPGMVQGGGPAAGGPPPTSTLGDGYQPEVPYGSNPGDLPGANTPTFWGPVSYDDFYNPGGDRSEGLYNPNLPGNAPATPGWPSNLPRPPNGVLPGTPAYHQWLRSNGIDGRSPLNYMIQQELVREGMGYTNPNDVSPWGDAGNYSKYVSDYLNQMGLGAGQAPDAFRQDLYDSTYSGIMNDARSGAQYAADMAGNAFDAEDATHFGALSDYANNLYDPELGGLAGFDYRPLQEAGIAQAEIARAATESRMAQQLAGTGLSGQANSIYAQAPMYNDYMQNRISAMTDPAMRSAELGIAGMGMASGALGDLYGLEQQGDLTAANIYGDLYGRGLGIAAGTAGDIGLGAGVAGLDAFLQQQDLYSRMPMQGYQAALAAALARNQDIDSMYGMGVERESMAKDRRAQRRAEDRQRWNDMANNMGMTVDTIMGGVGMIPGMGGGG